MLKCWQALFDGQVINAVCPGSGCLCTIPDTSNQQVREIPPISDVVAGRRCCCCLLSQSYVIVITPTSAVAAAAAAVAGMHADDDGNVVLCLDNPATTFTLRCFCRWLPLCLQYNDWSRIEGLVLAVAEIIALCCFDYGFCMHLITALLRGFCHCQWPI